MDIFLLGGCKPSAAWPQGREKVHWRSPLPADWRSAHLLLHYVYMDYTGLVDEGVLQVTAPTMQGTTHYRSRYHPLSSFVVLEPSFVTLLVNHFCTETG